MSTEVTITFENGDKITEAEIMALKNHLENLDVPNEFKKQWEEVEVIIGNKKVTGIIATHYDVPEQNCLPKE